MDKELRGLLGIQRLGLIRGAPAAQAPHLDLAPVDHQSLSPMVVPEAKADLDKQDRLVHQEMLVLQVAKAHKALMEPEPLQAPMVLLGQQVMLALQVVKAHKALMEMVPQQVAQVQQELQVLQVPKEHKEQVDQQVI